MEEQLHLGDDNALIALRQAWEESLVLLANQVNKPAFESWFKTAKPLSIDGHTVTIGAASEMAKIFLEKYAEPIKSAVEATLGGEVEISFVVAPLDKPKPPPSSPDASQRKAIVSPISDPLNEKCTFPNFIVGPCNRLAHAACLAVARQPGNTYNPLFLYGGSGLGKTHLLQAIAHYVVANHPGMRVAYVSGETFTYQYVSSLREHRSEDFRRRYRTIDTWLVDDIQFIAGKERTKEEFFHTFNTLYQTGKQIVISSDRAPKDLNPVEDRLKSRFESGLVADIAPPDFETRLAILQEKAEAQRAQVPDEVLSTVANLIPTNVRALEGALITLVAYASLMKTKLTPALAEEIVHRYLIEKKCTELTVDTVRRVVAGAFGMSEDDLRGSARRNDVVTARHVGMYLSRELTGQPLAAIGKAFGGRDHTTILHGCNRVKKLIEQEEALRGTVTQLADDLRAGRY